MVVIDGMIEWPWLKPARFFVEVASSRLLTEGYNNMGPTTIKWIELFHPLFDGKKSMVVTLFFFTSISP